MGRRRARERPAPRHPRRGGAATRLAAGERRATDRRPLRIVHGRSPHRPARPGPSASPARRDRAPRDARRRGAGNGAAARSRHPRALRGGLLPRQPRADAGDRERLRERPGPARPRLLREAGAALREAREKYRAHVAQMFTLAGRRARRRPAAAEVVFAVENEARRGFARQRRAARPRRHRPQDDARRPSEADPAPRLGRVLRGHRPPPRRPQRAASPGSCRRSIVSSTATTVAEWKTYLEWHLLRSAASALPAPFVDRELPLQRGVPGRRQGDEAAVEALRRIDRRAPRRSPGQEVHRQALPAGGQGPHAGPGEEPALGHGRHHPGPRLDGARDQEEGAREARDLQPEDRLSGHLEGLQPRAHPARRVLGQRRAPAAGSGSRTIAGRSASPWTAGAGA